jgi:hypothetical protein
MMLKQHLQIMIITKLESKEIANPELLELNTIQKLSKGRNQKTTMTQKTNHTSGSS